MAEEWVSTTVAAGKSGLPARTVPWGGSSGKISTRGSGRGRLVSLGEVQRLAAMTGRGEAGANEGGAGEHGKSGQMAVSASESDGGAELLERQLQALLRPFLDDLGAVRQQLGRVEV